MARERKAKPMADFFKFTQVGQAACGWVSKYRTSEQGTFVVLEPVIIKESSAAKAKAYKCAAVGLSTDLKLKVNGKDEGRIIAMVYEDTEATTKGNPKKLFRVLELTIDEFNAKIKTAEDRLALPYEAPEPVSVPSGERELDIDDVPVVDDDMELPF